jgi:hypothetical protein
MCLSLGVFLFHKYFEQNAWNIYLKICDYFCNKLEKSGSISNLIDAKVQSDARVCLVFKDAHHVIGYVNQETYQFCIRMSHNNAFGGLRNVYTRQPRIHSPQPV